MKNIRKIVPILIGVIAITLPFQSVFGATNPINDFCSSPTAQSDADARAECENLRSLQNSNTKIKSEKDSIENEIRDIDSQIQIALQKIKVQTIIISKLNTDIGVKSKTVASLESKIETNLDSLTNLLQKVGTKDSVSIVEVFLGFKHFSDFFVEVDAYATLNREITSLVNSVKSMKMETEAQKTALEDRKDKETDAKMAIEEQKRLIDRKKIDKNLLLKVKTSEYGVAQKLLATQKQKVAQIRSRLFKFQDGEGIPFGDAYDFAVKAGLMTGVRPAFVLGILMQESSFDSTDSSFGKNVGQCYLLNTQTGEGVGANTGTSMIRVMNPTRDVPIFLSLTSNLGRDYTKTRVSCWIKAYSGGLPFGWGGAMGAAQFIPSTWELYKKRIASVLGVGADETNPWNPEHAIVAASFYLSDLGAGLQTPSAEKKAACKYYSGKICTASSVANKYGTSVMKWVAKIQEEMIDPLQGN